MRNRLGLLMIVTAALASAAEWRDATATLTPGMRIEVQHEGKVERGLFVLVNGSEIVITTAAKGFLTIPQAEVERVMRRGKESPNLSFFANASDQLFPKTEVLYERVGTAQAQRKPHWWSKG